MFKVVKTSFRKTCLHMRKHWLLIKEKESESSVSVVSKSGAGSFGSGETTRSPNFGTMGKRKRDAKTARKTTHLRPCPKDRRLKFTQSESEDDDKNELSFVTQHSNLTVTPTSGPAMVTPAPEVTMAENVSLSSNEDSLELPQYIKPRYVVVEEEKNEVSRHSKKTVTFAQSPPKEMIKEQKPKVYDIMGATTDKLAALEKKFADPKKPVFTQVKGKNGVYINQRVLDDSSVKSSMTEQPVRPLVDSKSFTAIMAEQSRQKKDITELYEFVL